MTDAEQIMKRCQAGTRNYEEANNLHAACYGIIGKLLKQRTWVGLTDDDTFEIGERLGLADVAWIDLMKAIEAKLKEVNT